MSQSTVRVLVWGENLHEERDPTVRSIYPQGMHTCIAAALGSDPRIEARTATLQDPEHGLSEATLRETDVLTWWGHVGHDEVDDEVVARVQSRVWEGMGLIALHSAHYSKVFRRLLGTSCSLTWRETGERERLWNCAPGHPITAGIGRYLELERSETYGEPFRVPAAEEQIFVSWFQGGEVFRSGCTWRRGNGRIFYFGPGHETYPIYHDANVQRVLRNAVLWAKREHAGPDSCPNVEPVEPV